VDAGGRQDLTRSRTGYGTAAGGRLRTGAKVGELKLGRKVMSDDEGLVREKLAQMDAATAEARARNA